MSSQWARLERYARWKQGNMDLHALPVDAFLCVCGHLSSAKDRTHLVSAVYGPFRDLWTVPPGVAREVWDVWRMGEATTRIRSAMIPLVERALFPTASDGTTTFFFANWSVFTSHHTLPTPLVAVNWEADLPRIKWHDGSLTECARRALDNRSGIVSVNAMRVIVMSPSNRVYFLFRTPLMQTQCEFDKA